jgi:hypothetical protein
MARCNYAMAAFILATAVACLGAQGIAEADKPAKQWYAQPLELEEGTHQLFDDMGANVLSYRFRLPPDTQLFVVMLAKDEKGERIESLSKIYTLTPKEPGQPFETNFRLVHIDPSHFVEGYQGKTRWVMHVGRMTQQTWEPNRYRATGSYTSWWQGLKVESPEIDKDYFLWEVKANPKELRRILPDSPATFSIELRFRYERMEPGHPYGASGEGGNDDEEFAREVPDPRIKRPK